MYKNFDKILCLVLCLLFTQQSIGQTCGSAIAYDPYVGGSIALTPSGNDSANNSASCGLDGDDAIWVSISIPSFAQASQLTITLDNGWGGCGFFCTTDPTGALYTGSCGSLTAIDDCIDMSGGFGNGNNGPWTYSVTPGNDYFFRLSEEDDQGLNADLTFTLDDLTLPLELASFEGKAQDKENLLEWTTVWEENVEWFIIEKSLDGESWGEYDRVAAAGNSSQDRNYRYVDITPSAQSYYRLRMVDFDGYTDFSDMIYIERKEVVKPISSIYPNPSKGAFKVELSEGALRGEVNVSVFNVLGEVVLVQAALGDEEGQVIEVDLSEFPNGLYFIGVQGADAQFQMEKVYKE